MIDGRMRDVFIDSYLCTFLYLTDLFPCTWIDHRKGLSIGSFVPFIVDEYFCVFDLQHRKSFESEDAIIQPLDTREQSR